MYQITSGYGHGQPTSHRSHHPFSHSPRHQQRRKVFDLFGCEADLKLRRAARSDDAWTIHGVVIDGWWVQSLWKMIGGRQLGWWHSQHMENLKDPFIVDFPVKIKEFSSSLCKRLPEGNPSAHGK